MTNKKRAAALSTIIIITAVILLASCKGNGSSKMPPSPFDGRDTANLDGYSSMSDYDRESRFVDTTVAEIDQLMKDNESFVFLAAYEDCDYCSRVLPYINDALADAGTYAGYLDTRRDPSWMSNMDIDDYDLFVKRFGKYLQEDEDGTRHLYTPDLYVIRNGRVVAEHQGVVEGADDPSKPLTSSQEEELRKLLDDMLSELR